MTSRIVDVSDVTASDVERWRALADDAVEPNVFFGPEFLTISQRHFADLGTIKLLVVEEDARWVALLAFEMAAPDRWWPVRHASTAGPILYEYTSLGTPLVASDDTDARVDALVAGLQEHRVALGFAVVVHLLSDGPVGTRLSESLAGSGFVHQWRDDERAGADLATPLTGLSSLVAPRRAKELERKMRRMAEARGAAPADVRLVEQQPDPSQYLAFELASWKGTEGGPAFGLHAATDGWFRELFAALADRGQARQFALVAGDRAVYLGTYLRSGPTVYGWYDAYAPGDARFSPGVTGRLLALVALSQDPATRLLDTCMDPARYTDQTALYPGRVRVRSLTATLGPAAVNTTLRARASAGPMVRTSLTVLRSGARRAASGTAAQVERARLSVRGAARSRRAALVERARWRLGFYDDHALPAVPRTGISLTSVRLRPYRSEDASKRIELESSPGMELWDEDFVPMTGEEQFRAWFRAVSERMKRERGPYSLAIEDLDTGLFLGDLTLWRQRDQKSAAELGIALMPHARGRGIAREVIRGAIEWLFASGAFRRVELHHVVENAAMCTAATAAGAPVEGTLKRVFSSRGSDGSQAWHDGCLHGCDVVGHAEASPRSVIPRTS